MRVSQRAQFSTKRSRGVPFLKERAERASRKGRSACEPLQPSSTNLRLSMTGHRQSARAGVPTRPRCVSRHGWVAVNRPRKPDRRSERDAMCLSVSRGLGRGGEWRSRLIKLPLASGPAPQAAFLGVSPIPRSRTQAPPSERRRRSGWGS